MTLTKAQLIAETRAQADATGSARWADSTIAILLDLVARREWSRILSENPVYRWSQRNEVTDQFGQFAVDNLSTDAERLHKILQIRSNNITLRPLQVPEQPFVEATTTDLSSPRWYFLNSLVQVLPVSVGQPLQVAISHRPKPISEMLDTHTVIFPEEYEPILFFEGAALMLSKGTAETGQAAELMQLAELMRRDMLSDIGKQFTGPRHIGFPDLPENWGT